MSIRPAVLITLSLAIGCTSAFAQDANDIMRLFGGIMQGAITQASQAEWKKLSQSEMSCVDQNLRQQGSSLQTVIQQGITPSDPRVAGSRSACRNQIAQQPIQAQSTIAPSIFVVDGLALGGRVIFDSQAYREYQCSPSEQFAGFTWCQKKRQESSPRGQYLSSNSILHSTDGAALYINRYLEPAWFSGNEANEDIGRLSKKFGAPSRIIPIPQQSSVPNGMIATWGKVVLEPLDTANVSELAAGHDIHVGFMIDHIGNFQRSAQQGLPIYRLSGGAGYVWAASWDQRGKGIRFNKQTAPHIRCHSTPAFPCDLGLARI
jgi:hypothetical protein